MDITKSVITFIRGDDDSMVVRLDPTGDVRFQPGDKVFFCLRAKEDDKVDIFQKEVDTFLTENAIENIAARIDIAHSDTINLPLTNYWYTVWIEWANGTVKTVVRPTKFQLVAGGSHG